MPKSNNYKKRFSSKDALQSNEKLRQSEERLSIIIEFAVDFAIINTNTQGIVEAWNKGAEKIFGYTPDEIIGKSAQVIFTEEDRLNKVPEKEMAAAREKGFANDERWHKRKDGSRFFASGVMRPIYNPGFTGFLKIVRDMTSQKLAEQQKDDFISIASHELKTPVTSIKAYTEVLHEILRESGDVSSAELMEKMDAQIDRLIDLIRALLDTSKLAQGELILNPSTFDFCNLIEERMEDLQRLSSKHHLIIQKPKEIFITADRERIGQVLNNLISNAIKYSPNGGDITINWKKEKDTIEVSVSDKGLGISQEMQQKVFDRFFRVQGEQMKNYPGLGLGLYITAHIVHKHGGKIWVKSKPGEGSTFYFTLPL